MSFTPTPEFNPPWHPITVTLEGKTYRCQYREYFRAKDLMRVEVAFKNKSVHFENNYPALQMLGHFKERWTWKRIEGEISSSEFGKALTEAVEMDYWQNR